MKNKNLDEIRPATKGVKTPPRRPVQQQTKPQIIKDVKLAEGEVPVPSEEAAKIVIENNRAKERLMESIKGVNKLMNWRVLPENRSVKENDEERAIITELVSAAIVMEELSPGEGLLGMATLAVRQGLSLRDAGNYLAYELELVKNELKKIQERIKDQK